MKKPYCKPQIVFEDFELCADIAKTCSKNAGPSDVGQCGFVIAGIGKLFLCDSNNCEFKVYVDGQFGLCYHIPIETYCLFNS